MHDGQIKRAVRMNVDGTAIRIRVTENGGCAGHPQRGVRAGDMETVHRNNTVAERQLDGLGLLQRDALRGQAEVREHGGTRQKLRLGSRTAYRHRRRDVRGGVRCPRLKERDGLRDIHAGEREFGLRLVVALEGGLAIRGDLRADQLRAQVIEDRRAGGVGRDVELPELLLLVTQVGERERGFEVRLLGGAVGAGVEAEHGIRRQALLFDDIQMRETDVLPGNLRGEVLGGEIVAAIARYRYALGSDQQTGCIDLLAEHIAIDRHRRIGLPVGHAVRQGDVAVPVQIAQCARNPGVDVGRARELDVVSLAGNLQEIGDLGVGQFNRAVDRGVVIPVVADYSAAGNPMRQGRTGHVQHRGTAPDRGTGDGHAFAGLVLGIGNHRVEQYIGGGAQFDLDRVGGEMALDIEIAHRALCRAVEGQ